MRAQTGTDPSRHLVPSPGFGLVTADFNELEPERFDLTEDTVERGLVRQVPKEQGVALVRDREEIRERRKEAVAEDPAHADLVSG
jgi:hypothetical protein